MLQRMRYWLGPRRPWLWILLVLLLYTLAGFVLAPWLVERQLINLSAERADLTTSIDNIDINPYTLTFNMEGVNVTDSEAAPLLALERVFINFELVSVVRRAWSFDEFHVIGLDVALERYSDGDTNVGAVAERWNATADPQQDPQQEPEPQQDGDPVRLVIADLVVASAAMSVVDNVPEERFEARVDALDLAVENLSTLPDDTAGQGLTLTMGNGAVLTWTGTSSLNPLHSEGRVTLQGAYPDLVYEYFREQLPFAMSGGEVAAELNYRAGAGADDALSADITDVQFSMMDTVLSDRDSGDRLVSLPEVSLENGELHWPANTVYVEAVRLRGSEFHPVREQDGSINFVTLIEGMPLGQEDADAAQESDPWQLGVAELALEDWLIRFNDRVPEQEATVELDLNATLMDISTVPDSQMRLDSRVTVASGGALSLEGTLVALPQLQFDGELALDELELELLQPYIDPLARITIEDGHLAMAGTVAANADTQRYQGDVSINELALIDQNEEEELFSMDSLLINGIALELRDEPRLDVAEIRMESPYARVVIEEDGSTNISRVMASPDAGDDDADSDVGEDIAEGDTDVAEQLMAIAVDRMVVDSARADFADRSLPVPFSVSISELGGDISALSTRSEQPAAIDLEGQVGEFGVARIGGELRPLAYAENTQVDLVLRNIDMSTLSPYVIEFAGREIDDGRLDADLTYRIEDGRVDGDNTVVMRDLSLGDEVSHPDAADLPLGLAVALLQDRDGVIDLEVPVSGDVNNPEFSYGQIISEAISNVLSNIVTSPFRFLAGLVGSGEEDLAVIGFAPGRSDVAPPDRQKLAELAEALAQRPQLQLQVPPVYATQADEEALALQLLDERIEERMSASEDAAEDDMTAAGRRVMILEEMMVTEGLAVEQRGVDTSDASDASANTDGPVSLAVLRLQHLMPAEENEEVRLDEQAYADSLRTRLREQQSVPAEELDALATQRAEQVLAVITESRAELEAQTGLAEVMETEVNDDGRIVMTLDLDTGS